MRKVSAVVKAEKACRELLDVLVEVKVRKLKLDLADLEHFVEASERLHAVLDRALAVEKEQQEAEVGLEEEEESKEAAKGKRPVAKAKATASKSSAAARPQREKRAPKRVEEVVESDAEKPQRKRRGALEAQKDLEEQEQEEEEEEEEEEGEKEREKMKRDGKKQDGKKREKEKRGEDEEQGKKKRGKDKKEVGKQEVGKQEVGKQKQAANQVVVRPPAKKLKQGDASRGPGGELVLFFGKQGNSIVECPVFGKDYDEEFGTENNSCLLFQSSSHPPLVPQSDGCWFRATSTS